jgi:hypothetical protein
MNYKELKDIHKKAKKIVSSNLTWEEKYNIIFSEEISYKTDFDWVDPDMDYEDDVMAYMNAFDDCMVECKINYV